MSFLQSRRWRVGRRIALVLIVLLVAYRNYGDTIAGWFRPPGPETDIVITHSEFRTDLGGDPRPAWFIGLENRSDTTVYDNVVLEATYSDGVNVLERDTLVVDQRLAPGQKALIGSRDSRVRRGVETASLRVLDAEVVK